MFSLQKTVVCVLAALLVCFCGCTTSHTQGDNFAVDWEDKNDGPERVVILPFENDTAVEDFGKRVRQSFYNHFSSKNYHDIELSEVDRILEILAHDTSRSWRELPASKLGAPFYADFLVYGTVHDLDKYFFGVYSQVSLTVELTIVRCEDGQTVWETVMTQRSHDGGVPFDLFGVIPVAVRSGSHLLDQKSIEIVERLTRELAAKIPDPPSPTVLPIYIEIQVASFLEGARAEQTRMEIDRLGFQARIETTTLKDRKWHRVIVGPYHDVQEAEITREAIRRQTSFNPIYIHHYPGETQPDPA